MRILNVAEKNDAAKQISRVLSKGRFSTSEGQWKYNKIYSFTFQGFRDIKVPVEMIFTSVSGHMDKYELPESCEKWTAVKPEELFTVPVKKVPNSQGGTPKLRNTIENEARKADVLVIWTDCDREGENIGFEIIQACQAVKPKLQAYRARFSDMTPETVLAAVEKLEEPNVHLSEAVDCRQELDLRIGVAFTRFQTLLLQKAFPQHLKQRPLTCGTCQLPTLGFIVERYKKVQEFTPMPCYRVIIRGLGGVDFEVTNDKQLTKAEADEVARKWQLENQENTKNLPKLNVVTKVVTKQRPLPLNTVELEKVASRALKISASEVMCTAERLYTQGNISYCRTETNVFSPTQDIRALVEAQTKNPVWGSFATKLLGEKLSARNGPSSDQAHPPIHPTTLVSGVAREDAAIYDVIVRHFLACLSTDAEGTETKTTFEFAGQTFESSSFQITNRGFLEVYPYLTWTENLGAVLQPSGATNTGAAVVIEEFTKPPDLLTEADLIGLMDENGVGTDATHAKHIETLKTRGYIESHSQSIIPTPIGLALIEGYQAMGGGPSSFTMPDLRANLEKGLMEVAFGRQTKKKVLEEQIEKYRQILQTADEKSDVMVDAFSSRLRVAAKPKKHKGKGSKKALQPKQDANSESANPIASVPDGQGSPIALEVPKKTKSRTKTTQSEYSEQVQDLLSVLAGPDAPETKRSVASPAKPLARSDPVLASCRVQAKGLDKAGADDAPTTTLKIPKEMRSKSLQNIQPTDQADPGTLPLKSSRKSKAANPRSRKKGSKELKMLLAELKKPDKAPNVSSQPTDPGKQPAEPLTAASPVICKCSIKAEHFTVTQGPHTGRKFYGCSKGPPSKGGCGFHTWDERPVSSGSKTISLKLGAKMCACGKPSVRKGTKRGGKEAKYFFCCRNARKGGCDFFEWVESELT